MTYLKGIAQNCTIKIIGNKIMIKEPKVFWLIEDSDTHLYYYVSERIGQVKIFDFTDDDCWTSDAYCASFFDTETEAKEVIDFIKKKKEFSDKNIFTTEHMFY